MKNLHSTIVCLHILSLCIGIPQQDIRKHETCWRTCRAPKGRGAPLPLLSWEALRDTQTWNDTTQDMFISFMHIHLQASLQHELGVHHDSFFVHHYQRHARVYLRAMC